ncbi:MAG: T9SS type A sorting domain-containing protein, partial [Fimbriimonadaceae bacterium]|nr:T9SS type A sorting domain-containing protein [Chitinophagales bacterium]
CAVDNYTFPHELGHLYGCRHDVYVDGTDDPYAYGHGYVNLDEEWRTVMAYNDLCEDNSADCERLPYFSNPGVTYGGDAMGVSGESDNESALEASMSDIASLESTVSAKSLPSETIDDDEKGDVIATTSVTNTDTYIISSGADITWRAGSSITLALNFTASSGSVFNAFLDDCDALRLASEESSGNEEISIKNTLIVYPNPFHHTANVSIMLNADAIVTIRLIDILGNQILNLSDAKYYSEGQHVFPVNDPELGSGIYFVEANINGERKLHEIIKVD